MKLLAMFLPFLRKMCDMSRRLIWGRQHEGTMNDRERALAHYERYANDMKASVPADQLLVFKVSEGWEPLCAFLGVPVPDGPFPNVNDRAEVKKLIRGLIVSGYVTLALGAAAILGLIYLAIRWIG